jgi:very-short-patch-repair endonuclease
MAGSSVDRPRAGGVGAHARVVFEELVARQAGVVSLAQAAAHGYSADRVRRRVREGRWRRLHPGVVLVGGHRLTDEARVRAAWLWVGPLATVVGPAAAYWHGMWPRVPTSVDTAVPSRMGSRRTSGVGVRRRDLPDADVAFLRGVRVTGLALTALETAVVLPDGSAFLDRALQKYVPFADVYRAYCRSLGHRGSADMCRLLVAAADRADSAAERLVVRLLRAAGVTGWVLGHPFGPYTIDVAFPGAMVAVEIDGWAWHVDQDRFVGDRRKQNALVRAGWTVLRFTWHDLTRAPRSVVAQIVAALERAA